MNIFEMLYPRFYFDKSKPIRLFEAFSGVGCQAMALKRITDKYELIGFSEIDVHAIKSYQAIHGEHKNYGDITLMGEIPHCDIFTWSFPCTDLSKAGKQAGLTNTRSGLVYEVLRLLREIANYYPLHRHIPKNSKTHSMGQSTDYYQPIPNRTKLPKVLIMENVVDLVQVKFVKAFNEIQRELEELGYTNYNEVLNAKDYSIPQNRDRVFMVSILGDEENEHYSFAFPPNQKLKLRLKDLLEDEVDEKYYKICKSMLKAIEDGKCSILTRDGISNTVTTTQDRWNNAGFVIRKNGRLSYLTELETWRLMGISDEDFYKAKNAGVSNSQLYKQAGNGICISVFEAILREMIR